MPTDLVHPLATPVMSKPLEELLRMIPEGGWSLNEQGHIIDPDGNEITLTVLQSPKLTRAQRRIYSQLFVELINRTPDLLTDLRHERERIYGLFKEVRHIKQREHVAYRRGITDAINQVYSVPPVSPTARDALNTVIDRLSGLVTHDSQEVPSSGST